MQAKHDEQEEIIKNTSLLESEKQKKRDQALDDAEEAQLQAALALSAAYHKEENNKIGQQEKDINQ